MSDSAHELRRHRALADASRLRLLARIAAAGPMGIRDLATATGLHVNTVRAHIGILEEAGLVAGEPQPQADGGRGRPRQVYRAVTAAAPSEDSTDAGAKTNDHHRLLAEILAAAIAQGATSSPEDFALVAEAWGRHLIDDADSEPGEGALAELVSLLEGLGFSPEIARDGAGDADRIVMRPCPFQDLAQKHQQIVCPIHLGIMRGALAQRGADFTTAKLVPYAEPGACIAQLSRLDADATT